jgi:hypothetical protein
MPGKFPGSPIEDEFNVVFTNGKVESISENFPPGTSQALARATIAVLIPADAQLAFSAINIGKCAVEQLVSRSLGVEGANGGSLVVVVYKSGYALGSEVNFSGSDVREVSVSEIRGVPERPQPSATGELFCL